MYVSLYEPPKREVIAFEEGGPVPDRLAKVVIRERAEHATYEAVVRLPDGAVLSLEKVPGVQPSVMFEEFMAAEDIVRKDPRWQEAMRKRGITDFDLCMIDPWSTPNVEPGVGPDDGRFVSPLTWVRDDPDDNGYAHPVDGVVTRVDLDTMTVVSVEDYGVIPVPQKKGNYSTAKISDPENVPYFPDGPRTDVKPLDITQHDGPSFTVDGYHLSWQKWDLRIGFTAREGLVLHRISYDGRSIIHRASLSEMFVPYGDPGPMHYRKLVLDEGEYGIGLLTNSLELGCDCLGEIAYLDGVVNDNDGKAVTMPNAICLHEEDHGIAWKHTDFRTGYVGSQADAEDGRLQHRHRRQLRVRLLLVPVPGRHDRVRGQALRRDLQRRRAGRAASPSTASSSPPASTARTTSTSSTSAWTWRSTAPPTGSTRSPRPPTRRARTTPSATPGGRRKSSSRTRPWPGARPTPWPAATGRSSTTTSRTNSASPSPTSCCRNHVIRPFAHPGSAVARRAPFMFNPVWVTAYDKDELFATGDYPNQAAGGAGLPAFVARERDLTDTDVVVWFTFGTNHVARPEDWPVMPVHPIGFKLLPSGFFVGNPALDNPQPGGDHCHHH